MSKHRSALTATHSAFDFDVVTDAPRPFKVRPDIPADAPAAMSGEAPHPTEAPASPPARLEPAVAK